MSVQDFNIHTAMRSYESLHAETLNLLEEGHEHAAAVLKAEEGIRVKVEHYFEKLRTANQKMEGIVTSLTGKVNAYQLKEYQTDLEQLKKKVALVQSFFLEKKVEERAEEGKSDQEEAAPASRAPAPLPDEMRLEVFKRLSLEELPAIRRVSKGWNALYNSAIKEELTLLANTLYPKDAAAAQAFKKKLYASLADRSDRRNRDGIDKLSSTECLLLAVLITNNIRGFQQEERLSSTFPLLHPSLQNALAMRAALESEEVSDAPYHQKTHLEHLVDRLRAAEAIPQAVALATAIPHTRAQSWHLSAIARKALDCGHSLEEVMAILRLIPIERDRIRAADEVANDLINEINEPKLEEAIDLMQHFPVYADTIKKTIDLLHAQNNLERAISFARKIQNPYKKSAALEHISSIFMGKGSTKDAISHAREIPDPKIKAGQLYTIVKKLTDRKLFKEAQELAESIEILDQESSWGWGRWSALEYVVTSLAKADRFEEALILAREKIEEPNTQSTALVEIVKQYIRADHFSKAMDLIEIIQTPKEKDSALKELLFQGNRKNLIDEEVALTLARKIEDVYDRSIQLRFILDSRLLDPDTDLEAARALVEEIIHPRERANALQRIVQFMLRRGDDRAHILEIAHQIRDREILKETLSFLEPTPAAWGYGGVALHLPLRYRRN